jgi:hypothetical protein
MSEDKFEIPWCEEHHCEMELYEGVDDEPDYYECRECEREKGEALGWI